MAARNAWEQQERQLYLAAGVPDLTQEEEECQEQLCMLLRDILEPEMEPVGDLPLNKVEFRFPRREARLKDRLRAGTWRARRTCYIHDEAGYGLQAMTTCRDSLQNIYAGAWFASYENLWQVVDSNHGQLPRRRADSDDADSSTAAATFIHDQRKAYQRDALHVERQRL